MSNQNFRRGAMMRPMGQNHRGNGSLPPREEQVQTPPSLRYTADLPYPEITEIRLSQRNGRLLSTAFAGPAGELTACTQYVQHGMILRQLGAAGADMLQGVAVTEMYHLRIIGEMILKCGGRAAYYDWRRKSAWSGQLVKYPTGEREVWRLETQSERDAVSAYQWLRARVDDLCIVQMIDRILLDEQLHLELFREQAARTGDAVI